MESVGTFFLTRETLRNFFNATVCLTEHIQSLEMAPSISTGVLLINTSAKLMIVTGGDDSICRLWAVGFIMDKDSDSKNKIWRVRLLNKIEGHLSAIMDILHHPNDALVSTLDDSLAQFSRMDGEEKDKKIALSQSALDIAKAIASKVH